MRPHRLFIALLSLIPALGFAQSFTVTPTGLRDSNDPTKGYVVIQLEGQPAKNLYEKAVRFVNENSRSAKDAIRGQNDGEYLRYEVYAPDFITYSNSGAKVPITASFMTELRFKDGKVRYEIVGLDMYGMGGGRKFPLLFSGGLLDGYIVFRTSGKLHKEATKLDLERYFNARVQALTEYLSRSEAGGDW